MHCIRPTNNPNMGLLRSRNLFLFTFLAVILLPKIQAGELTSHNIPAPLKTCFRWMNVEIMQFHIFSYDGAIVYVFSFLYATNMLVTSINQSLFRFGPLNLKATFQNQKSFNARVFHLIFQDSLFMCEKITSHKKNVIYNAPKISAIILLFLLVFGWSEVIWSIMAHEFRVIVPLQLPFVAHQRHFLIFLLFSILNNWNREEKLDILPSDTA